MAETAARSPGTQDQHTPEITGIHHNCGLYGAYVPRPMHLDGYIQPAMRAIQTRGQAGAGLAYLDSCGALQMVKREGLVDEALPPSTTRLLGETRIFMAHLRYPTSGSEGDTQPFQFQGGGGGEPFILEHNGTAYPDGDEKLSDTYRIGQQLEAMGGFSEEHMVELLSDLDGAYNLMVLTTNGMYVAVDPNRFHPLRYGVLKSGGTVLASEDVALLANHAPEDFVSIGDVPRGMLAKVTTKGLNKLWDDPRAQGRREGKCSFEEGYLKSFENHETNEHRTRWGHALAGRLQEEGVAEGAHIVPVLNSGLTYAQAIHEVLREHPLAYDESAKKGTLLRKIEPSQRTFIESGKVRDEKIKKKYEIAEEVDGKDIVLVDDSVVRGNTMKRLVHDFLDHGANTVHLAIGLPPITHPCFHGVAFATKQELIFNMLEGHSDALQEYQAHFARWLCEGENGEVDDMLVSRVRITHLPFEDFQAELGDEWCYHCMTGELPDGVEVPVEVRTCGYATV